MSGGNILVLDVGSSALKAAVFDSSGNLVAGSEGSYGTGTSPERHPPNEWWWATVAAVNGLKHADIGAIVLTGMMENLIPIDAAGEPLGEAILYPDGCGAPFLAKARDQLEDIDATLICGNAPEPLMTGFKLMWLRSHDRERFDAARWFLPGARDFIALRLTGTAVTDPVCAATTGLMDIEARDWSEPLLAIAGIERDRLPTIRPATDIIGRLDERVAEELGLAPGTPVINGCGDAGATTLGGGADTPGDASLYIGTSGWVARIAESSVLEEGSPFYRLPHPLADNIIEIAPILSAGAAANWARGALGLEMEAAEKLAAQADSAPGNAVFLPYLNGERSPFLDLEVRGAFLGLDADDGPGELYYAALEGVALAIDANLRIMGGAGGRMTLSGGGALSPVWRSIIADIVGSSIEIAADPVSATSFGAFRIAQHALGLKPSDTSFSVAAKPRREREARVRALKQRFALATDLVRRFA
jgi:xylulokinase